MDEKFIKSELTKLRRKLLKDIHVSVFGLGLCVTILIWISIFFFNAFESHTFLEKITSVVGSSIIIFVIAYIVYFCLSIQYISINPHRFNFESGYVVDREYIPAYADYTNRTIEDDRPINQPDVYYIRLKGEKLRRRTFSWVYRKAVIGERYIIVLSGTKKRQRSKIVYIMNE